MTTITAQTVQVYQVFIKATPEQIWDAITKPEFTQKYFYGARISATPDRYSSLGPDGSVWGDDETGVLEQAQVLHHAEAGHLQLGLELPERAAVALVEAVEQEPPCRIGKRPEDPVVVHRSTS